MISILPGIQPLKPPEPSPAPGHGKSIFLPLHERHEKVMIRKLFYLSLILAVLALPALFVVKANLPVICSYALTRAFGGQTTVGGVSFSYKSGLLHLVFRDVRIRGPLEGKAKHLAFIIHLLRGMEIKDATVSDFEINLTGNSNKSGAALIPIEQLDLKNGLIRGQGQRLRINELSITGLKVMNPFLFSGDLENDTWFKTLKVSGTGQYRETLSDAEVKGKIEVTGISLDKLSLRIDGIAETRGDFLYGKKGLSVQGSFTIGGFQLKGKPFSTPFFVAKGSGKCAVTFHNGTVGLRLTEANYEGSPLAIDIRLKNDEFHDLKIMSGPLSVTEIKSHFPMTGQEEGVSATILDRIDKGTVSISRLTVGHKGSFRAQLELADSEFSYSKLLFTDVRGSVVLDDKDLVVSKMAGSFRQSTFSDFRGVIPFAKAQNLRVSGSYAVNLADLSPMMDTGDLKFLGGAAEGTLEIEGNDMSGYSLRGEGELLDGNVRWQKLAGIANGVYKFTEREVTFDPLNLAHGNTDVVISGKFERTRLDINVKGDVDVGVAEALGALPLQVAGVAGIDLAVEGSPERVIVEGSLDMTEVEFRVPGYVQKDTGTKSNASLVVAVAGPMIEVRNLDYNLDAIHLNLKGTLEDRKLLNLELAMNVRGVDRVAALFFLDDGMIKGDIDLKLAVRDLTIPLNKLPYMSGSLRIDNGFLRPPWLPKPFEEISLISDFKGEDFSMELNGFRCGESVVNKGYLTVEGFDAPRFGLSLDMEKFRLADFRDDLEFHEFHIPPIPGGSVLSRATGNLSLWAGKADLSGITGDKIALQADLQESTITVTHLKGDTLGGNVQAQGSIDLSGSVPTINAALKLRDIIGNSLLRPFGAGSDVIEGKAAIYANLGSRGHTFRDLSYGLNGNVAFVSADGVLRKWNLLSKIFGLLNVYDLFRGKVDLRPHGLPYRKMGATFTVTDSVLHTEDFLIDTPSMLITGNGTMDIKKHLLDGNIVVSPLLSLDTTIDRIPILRDILKQRNKGLFYAAYRVNGSMDDPDISINVVDSIGGKAVEILRNILVLPKEVFE
jgi:hypothetical protein